jgi:predicted  nucleic acid-binding Zn-ribbon protein
VDPTDAVNIFTAVLGVVGGVIAAIVTSVVASRRLSPQNFKDEGDAAHSISSAAKELIESYRIQLQEMRTQITSLSKEVLDLRTRIDADGLRIHALESAVASRDVRISELERIQTRHEDGIRRLGDQVISLGAQPVYQAYTGPTG